MFLQHDFKYQKLSIYLLLSILYGHFSKKNRLAHELLIPPVSNIEVTL